MIYNYIIQYDIERSVDMISKKELAKELSVSIPTIDRYMKDGMPYHKIGKKLVRFYLNEVFEWLKKGQ